MKAVDEFAATIPEKLILVPDLDSTVMIIKIRLWEVFLRLGQIIYKICPDKRVMQNIFQVLIFRKSFI